jgi:hypothetical protein
MDNQLVNKLQNSLDRISAIKAEIKAHKKNIKLLHHHALHHKTISDRQVAYRVVSFNNLGRSEARYRWSVKNLSMQIILLEKELETLNEYGI